MRSWPVLPILLIQTFLCLAHWFLYETWVAFWWPMSSSTLTVLRVAFGALSIVFVVATVLGFRFSGAPVRLFYRLSASWMGLANFLFVGALIAWLIDGILRVATSPQQRIADMPFVVGALLAICVGVAIYGLINARALRIQRITVELPRLPQCWKGRQALLISDMHLGHVNGASFARRVVETARRLNPAIIFLAGDVFDGSKVNPDRMVAPLRDLEPPLGVFFVGGNHEEFGGAAHFEDAMRGVGIRVLHNECVTVDGVSIVGVPYGPAAYPLQMAAFLNELGLKNDGPSILLKHVPNQLPLAEHAGVSLQLSGHTHGGGQMFPYNLITRRAFGKFTYGLQRFGDMQVYTSSGAGTWGPPIRVGTHSEIVLLTFA